MNNTVNLSNEMRLVMSFIAIGMVFYMIGYIQGNYYFRDFTTNKYISSAKMTNFEKVGQFHTTFDNPKFEKLNRKIFDPDNEALVKLRTDLIDEEVEELKTAIKNHDFVEIADALTDILYVVYGAGHVYGINLDETFAEVHRSNMTKACVSEAQAEETVRFIKETEKRYREPEYKLSPDGKYYIVYDNHTGKVLKNQFYRPANLTFIEDDSDDEK